MIETIDVKINGKTYKYSKGISVAEVLTEHTQNFKYPIILAKINNRLRELSASIEEDSEVEFLDLTSPEGNRVHVNGLIMVLFYAISKSPKYKSNDERNYQKRFTNKQIKYR